MSYQQTSQSTTYIEALRATEGLEPPGLGFVKPEAGAVAVQLAKSIKQNNTIIQLIITLADKIQKLQSEVTDLKQTRPKTNEHLESVVEDLSSKLEGLKLGEGSEPPRKRSSKYYVFTDPIKIFASEKEKLQK